MPLLPSLLLFLLLALWTTPTIATVTVLSYQSTATATKEIRVKNPSGHDPTGYPVYMWTTGTTMCKSGAYGQWRYSIDNALITAMSDRGYVSGAVDYSCFLYIASCEQLGTKVKGAYDATTALNSAIEVMCAQPKANCSKGVAVHGFSQGAHVAAMAGRYDDRVTAALLFGNGNKLGGGFASVSNCLRFEDNTFAPPRRLPRERLRSIVGETDGYFGSNMAGVKVQQKGSTGYDCGENVDCIQDDGSGYFVVAGKGHGFFYNSLALTTAFKDGTEAWSMNSCLDWLAAKAIVPLATSSSVVASDDAVSPSSSSSSFVSFSPSPFSPSSSTSPSSSSSPSLSTSSIADSATPSPSSSSHQNDQSSLAPSPSSSSNLSSTSSSSNKPAGTGTTTVVAVPENKQTSPSSGTGGNVLVPTSSPSTSIVDQLSTGSTRGTRVTLFLLWLGASLCLQIC